MNGRILVAIVMSLILSHTGFANNSRANWEETLVNTLNKAIPGTAFSIESVKVNSNQKQLSGKGTFFNKPNIGFEAQIGQDGSIHTFKAIMPSNAKVSVSNSALSKMAGQSFTQLIPNALGQAVYLEGFGFGLDANKELAQVTLNFNALNNWEVLQGTGIALNQIKIDFTSNYPKVSNKRTLKGILTGRTKIAGKAVNLSAQLTAQKEQLVLAGQTGNFSFEKGLAAITGRSNFLGFDMPNVIFDLKLNDGQLNIAPYQKWATLSAISNWGLVDIWTKKKEKADKDGNKVDYIATITTHKDFKISNIHAKLSMLDKVNLANQKIVFSSAKKSKKETKKVPILTKVKTGIRKGCSIIAKLDVRKLKLEHLLQVKELVVNSPLTAKLDGVVLEAPLETNIKMGPSAKLEEVLFRLKPSPKDFGITLIGTMTTKVDKDALVFKGGMEVDLKSQALNFSALMDGSWKNPMGVKGMTMTDIGIQMGASFTTAPVILPNIAITGQLKAGSFSGAATVAFDTRNPTKSMIAANFNKVGLMDLMNLVTSSKVRNNIPKDMKKTLQTINLKAVKMEIVPQRLEVLEKTYEAGFRTAGNINVAGFNGFTSMDIDYNNGIKAVGSIDPVNAGVFKLKGANGNAKPAFIMDLRKGKKAQLGINGLVNLMGIEAATDIALLPNGFKFKVGGKVFNLFKGDISASGSNLSKAGEMALGVKMETDIMNYIDKQTTKFIGNSTKGATKKLTDAQKALTKAQKEVNKLEREIKKQRKIVSKEMKAKRAKYDAAKRKLTASQKKVNKLKADINKLKKQRSKLKAYQVAKKSALTTKIIALESSRVTAITALNAAKLVMSGFKGMNTNPDLHPKVASLIASKATAIGSLEAAKKTLGGIKWTLGATGKVASYAIEKGTDFLINIKKVDFAGKLGNMSGGAVKLNTDLEWMGKKQNLKFNFNFNNPAKSITDLGKKLMSLKK